MNGGSYDVPTTRARRTCRAAAVRAAACASAAYSAPPPRISCRRRRRGGDPPPPLFGDSGHAGGQQLPKDGSLDSQKLHAPRTQCGAAIPGVGVRLGHAQRVHAPGLAPSGVPKVTVLVPQNGEKKGEIGQSLGWGGEPRVQRRGGTTKEEHAVPADDAGGVLRARGGQKGAAKKGPANT